MTIVRVVHYFPTHFWFELVDQLFLTTEKTITGGVSTIPGPVPGEVDWLFELEEDALWFILKHGGEVITKRNPFLK